MQLQPLLTRLQFTVLAAALLQMAFFALYIGFMFDTQGFGYYLLPLIAIIHFIVLIGGCIFSFRAYARVKAMFERRPVSNAVSGVISLLLFFLLIASLWYPVRVIQIPVALAYLDRPIAALAVVLNNVDLVNATNDPVLVPIGITKIAVQKNDISVCMEIKDSWDILAHCFSAVRPGINERVDSCVDTLAKSSHPDAKGYACFLTINIRRTYPYPQGQSFEECLPLVPAGMFQVLFDKCVLPNAE